MAQLSPSQHCVNKYRSDAADSTCTVLHRYTALNLELRVSFKCFSKKVLTLGKVVNETWLSVSYCQETDY